MKVIDQVDAQPLHSRRQNPLFLLDRTLRGPGANPDPMEKRTNMLSSGTEFDSSIVPPIV
jgi:hypothetical protein